MLYQAYEMTHKLMRPYREAAIFSNKMLSHPMNPFFGTHAGKAASAALNVFESTTRRYGKPEWMLDNPVIADNVTAKLSIKTVKKKPFCHLLHFKRASPLLKKRTDPKVLVVAPMSGHYATLLRGTVDALLPDHDVYVTDWIDAREVSLKDGKFGLEDFISYVIEMIQFLGPDTHVIAVCQPGPAVLSAAAIMSEDKDPSRPASITLMGSPIDPRKSPTQPNKLATEKPIEWFSKNVIHTVPLPYDAVGRRVYPGFLQLTGFMTMNMERHYSAHVKLFENLVKNDGDSVDKHYAFYNEYLSVMDMTSDFYLETIEKIFQKAELPRGKLKYQDRTINLKAIHDVALMTIEGQHDDISGVGQTKAAHDLCTKLPKSKQNYLLHPTVGHYGVFNGSKWRNDIKPEIAKFIRQNPKTGS
ncbi:MAG: poly(3-hydroxybutyrate) depolymerase [Alphaproteobacteria bacterium]|jgi:poly(3-hydroxybutyrate) depolymerase